MEFVDIIFPQKVGVLTYRVPEALRKTIEPGMQVSADLRKALKVGIVLCETTDVPKAKLKDITEVLSDAPRLSPVMLRLMEWMSGYYIALEGTVLKSLLPTEFFSPVKKRRGGRDIGVAEQQEQYLASPETGDLNPEAVAPAQESLRNGGYKTFLLHAPSTQYERAYITEAAKGIFAKSLGVEGLIVAAPDMPSVWLLEAPLRQIYGQRLVLYHSGLNQGERTEAVKRIASGEAHAVLGSLMAVHAPLPQVRMIAVAHEESPLYKNESAPRSNARDVAVMRAYLEGATALLTSICPSVESWHNAQPGSGDNGGAKYTLLDQTAGARRPRVRIMNMYDTKGAFSEKLVAAVQRAADTDPDSNIGGGGRALLYVNKKGHSSLRCLECGHVDLCASCSVPLVYHKGGGTLRCALCGQAHKAPETCPECSGHTLTPSGLGLERLEDEFKALSPVGVDTKTRGRIEMLLGDEASLAVGTRTLTRSDRLSGGFRVVGVVNADSFIYQPDFRAAERAMQDLLYAADKTAPGGELIIQTRRTNHPMYANLRRFNLKAFYARELKERLDPGFPPHTRLALLKITSDARPSLKNASMGEAVEALGPVAAVDKKGRKHFKLLIKAADSTQLQHAVRSALLQLKGEKVEVDVDPQDL